MAEPAPYRLLSALRGRFEGTRYTHRDSTHGDKVAVHLFDDLYALDRSPRYKQRVADRVSVVNTRNLQRGIHARRGDGTFGEIVPRTDPVEDPNFTVHRGQVATIEIGVEVKMFAKAMIKQFGRVKSDMTDQLAEFKRGGGNPISVGIVGINYAEHCTSYEGAAVWPTTGRHGHRHPIQEAAEIEQRVRSQIVPLYDHFVVLRYRVVNVEPFPFEWVDYRTTEQDYGATLARISRDYEDRPTKSGHSRPT